MNEPDVHPLRDECRLPRDNRIEQFTVSVGAVADLGIVPFNHMIGKKADCIDVAARGEILKGADTDMARRDARHDRTRQRRLAKHALARRHRSQRPRRCNAQRCHGLADDVFAQDRADGCTPVAAPREGRRP